MTLLEVLVASAIFLAMTSVVFALLRQNQRASEKVYGQTDTTSQVMLVFEKVRAELRQARVIGVDAEGKLQYWILRRVNGVPQINALNRPDWLPGEPADPDVALMYVSQGVLWREFQGSRQPLAPVGPDGTVRFTWLAGAHILSLSGQVGQKYAYDATRNHLKSFRYDLFLNNNE